VIEDYGSYVLERKQLREEEKRGRLVIERAFARIADHVPHDRLQRRCVSVNQLLIRVLEQHGIWAFAVSGSVRYVFERSTGFEPQYTWAIDEQDFPGAFVGHAWLVVPPFDIVDCTAHFQSWSDGEQVHIPCPIFSKAAPIVRPELQVSIAENLRRRIDPHEMEPLRDLWRRFPPRKVILPKVTITYQAHGISVPDAPLAGIRNLVDDPIALFEGLLG
jgi:hypothetical protein